MPSKASKALPHTDKHVSTFAPLAPCLCARPFEQAIVPNGQQEDWTHTHELWPFKTSEAGA